MKKLLYLLSLLLFCFSVTHAQSKLFKITGVVKDSASQKAMDYATVHLKLKSSGANVKSTLTKDDGSFLLEVADTGKYNLVVIGLGHQPKTVPVALEADMDVGEIFITAASKNLSEVVVTADRPILKQDIDRLTYDIQADPESKVLNVLDMMRKVPLLSVDGEDNVQLKGSGNFKILLNGRPSAMLSRNLKDVLKSMSAVDIEKIEVITTPPAKYDSEGLAGIINIITKKKVDNGYNANISIRDGFPSGGPGGSASFTVKQGKFGVSGYGGYSKYDSPETSNSNVRNSFGSPEQIFSQLGTNSNNSHFNYGSTELSFEIDTLNLLTAEMGLNGYKSNNQSTLNALNVDENGELMQQYKLNNESDYQWGGINLSTNYQKNFKRNKEQLLTFSYQYNDDKNTSTAGVNISDQVNYPLDDYNQYNKSYSREQTFQVDYVHPVGKLNIEGGIKGILRDNNSDYLFRNYNSSTGDYELDPSRTNEFNNHQNIFGIYNSYQYKLKKWGFKGGLRLEETVVKADFVTSSSKVDQNYFNFIPTVAINHNLKNNISLNFGYTQRIERPGIWQLNPFVDRSNPNFISTGNPDLHPVISHNFNLGFSKFGKGSFNLSLGYDFANNTIQNVSVLNENITSTNYYNIGKNKKVSTNISINYPFTKKLNFNMGGNLNYIWLEGYLGANLYKNSGLLGYLYSSASYKFEHGYRVNGSFSYSSPWVRLQGSSNGNIYTSFSLSKEIVKDKLTFSAYVRNPFNKFRVYRSETTGENFSQLSLDNNYYRGYNLSLNYKFGKLKGDIKKNKRGIKNSDVQSGGNGGSNGN